jgi:hypothetical protein
LVGYWRKDGKRMHCVDASKDGRRHIMHADDLLAAFLELDRQCRSLELQGSSRDN